MSSTYMIKCIMCKSEFDQIECRTRFCDFCRSSKNRIAREAFYKKRKETRKRFVA